MANKAKQVRSGEGEVKGMHKLFWKFIRAKAIT
jgi:hypothetical protein